MTAEILAMTKRDGLQFAKDLVLPLDAITQTFLVVGKRGSGKSNTAARFVEQIHHAGLPFVVLDPVDTWWGLKAGRDGGRGLDVYVFGGHKQDLPLEASSGALIAEVLCEHRLSMVLSVKHLSGRERSAFMVAFAQTLFQKWGGGPLHLVLEEAHEFAPQMSGGRGNRNGDNEAAMLGAFKRLWKLGRSSGIGGTAVTQRPASLSKDITTQSEILIAHRTIGPQDVKAIGEWVKYHGEKLEMLADLPSMPTGEAFVWAPEFPERAPIGLRRTSILLRDTYDSASTPKVGERRVEPKELAAVDLERLRVKMSATIERAKAEDPRELRKQIADLKKQVAIQQGKVANQQPKVERVEVLTDADRALLAKVDEQLRRVGGLVRIEFAERLTDFQNAVLATVDRKMEGFVRILEGKGFQKVVGKLATVSPTAPVRATVHASPSAKPETRKALETVARTAARNLDDGATLPPARQKILNGLAFLEGIGVGQADKTQLALLCSVSPTSGGYFNNLGALRSAGFIEYPSGGTVAMTPEGRSLAETNGVPTSTAELHDAIRAKLPLAKWRILEAVIGRYPKTISKDDLAHAVDVSPTSGGYFNNLGSLRSLGLIEYPQPGFVVAKPVLFLEA